MCSSYVIGKEKCPSTGTLHLQMCLVLSVTMRFTQVTEKWPLCHWEPTRGIKASKIYCRKDGDFAEKGGSQGRRQELIDAVALIQSADSWKDVVNHPDLYLVMKGHHQWCRLMWDFRKVEPQTGLTLRPWQASALEYLQSDPDDRTIAWYHDWNGSTGKTVFGNFLVRNHGAVILGGRTVDILYAYQDEGIAIFTYPMDYNREKFHYKAMELIKDGVFMVSKFHSHMHVRIKKIHVIVLANAPPDRSRLSADRWGHVVELDERPVFRIFNTE